MVWRQPLQSWLQMHLGRGWAAKKHLTKDSDNLVSRGRSTLFAWFCQFLNCCPIMVVTTSPRLKAHRTGDFKVRPEESLRVTCKRKKKKNDKVQLWFRTWWHRNHKKPWDFHGFSDILGYVGIYDTWWYTVCRPDIPMYPMMVGCHPFLAG